MSELQRGNQPKVLIVDDQPETRVLLRAMVEEEGIEVVGTAGGGIDAVSMVGERAPDVILMDLRMPDLDGVQATRRIKATHPHVQVILLTFYSDSDLTHSAEEAGAFCYLVKGCPPAMVVEMIRRAWAYTLSDGVPPATDTT
jgi:DNA-binding NarL/FixJ family response regulator